MSKITPRNSLTTCDTNVLFYYLNASSQENKSATEYLSNKFDDENFCICELVLVELYGLLRNSAVTTKPMSRQEAIKSIISFRTNPYWRIVEAMPEGLPDSVMDQTWSYLSRTEHQRREIFDVRLAYTMKNSGITHFDTRNVKHFSKFEFLTVNNPIDK